MRTALLKCVHSRLCAAPAVSEAAPATLAGVKTAPISFDDDCIYDGCDKINDDKNDEKYS